MADSSSSSSSRPQKKNRSLPPKRGKIKSQIFESLVKSVASTMAKAGEALKGKGTNIGGGCSASCTPPSSTHSSDDNCEA